MKQSKQERKCNRCNEIVEKSQVDGYKYSCNSCDEDLYEFETHLEDSK